MSKVAVVTGGTSGIGKQTALALKAAGYTVYELSRRAQGVEGLHHLVADITREELVDAAIGEVLRQEGHIDVVVNNAGFGISGAIEFTKTEDAKRLFDADFFGMVNVNRAVIPHMRQAGAGRIVNLSSVAAAAPIPFQAYYSAAKAAVNSYTMALANELRPYGVTVCAVQPGDIHTGFTAAREKTIDGDDVYGGRISRSVARMEHDEQTGMDPAKAGAFIAKVAMKPIRCGAEGQAGLQPRQRVKKSLAEFAARRRQRMEIIFSRDMCVRENTSQAASVECVRHGRANYARSRLQAFCRKTRRVFRQSRGAEGQIGLQPRVGFTPPSTPLLLQWCWGPRWCRP